MTSFEGGRGEKGFTWVYLLQGSPRGCMCVCVFVTGSVSVSREESLPEGFLFRFFLAVMMGTDIIVVR